MGVKLTYEEWCTKPSPFFWLNVAKILKWPNVVQEMAEKWAIDNIKGWYYHDNDYWVFEFKEDAVTFKLFVMTDQFSEPNGSI